MTPQNQATPTLEQPLSLAERAYREVRDRLIMLDIAPGAPINEAKLAAELGVGRTPLREALKRLESEQLVVAYPRRGTFATSVDITQLADVTEMRVLLEPLAARRAARAIDGPVAERLRSTLEALRTLGSGRGRRELIEFDLTVHRLIYEASGSVHLEESLVRLDNLATRIWCMVLDRLPDIEGHIAEHVELLEAVVAGEGERAAGLAKEHVLHFEAGVRSVL